MRARVTVASLATAASVLGGCSVATSPTATPSASATAKATAVTTASPVTVVAVTLPAARAGAPSLATTGSSWPAIVKSLTAYGQWILGSPDPAKVADVAMPGCAVAESLTAQVNGLLTSEAYVQTTAPAITSVLGPSSAAGLTKVGLTVIAGRAAEPVISSGDNKTVISTMPALPESTLQMTLLLGADKKWRLCTIQNPAAGDATTDQAVPLI